jgi:nitrogen regulatory protein P-II 2
VRQDCLDISIGRLAESVHRAALCPNCWSEYAISYRILARYCISMKLIIAVIQPTKLDLVQQALKRIGVTRLTVCDAMGFARQRGQTETYRGNEYATNLLRKVELEIAVNDDFVDRTVECLLQLCRTSSEGTIGDGKIFVLPMEEAIQVSDGARGPGAI